MTLAILVENPFGEAEANTADRLCIITRKENTMKDITWKYVKPLACTDSITEYETLTGVLLPDDLKAAIIRHNGGRPSLKYYDIPTEKDKEFKALLSFNRNDIENVFAFYPLDSANGKLVPIASDPAGNLFVIKEGKIFLWLHESDTMLFLAESFSAFLEALHD